MKHIGTCTVVHMWKHRPLAINFINENLLLHEALCKAIASYDNLVRLPTQHSYGEMQV